MAHPKLQRGARQRVTLRFRQRILNCRQAALYDMEWMLVTLCISSGGSVKVNSTMIYLKGIQDDFRCEKPEKSGIVYLKRMAKNSDSSIVTLPLIWFNTAGIKSFSPILLAIDRMAASASVGLCSF